MTVNWDVLDWDDQPWKWKEVKKIQQRTEEEEEEEEEEN